MPEGNRLVTIKTVLGGGEFDPSCNVEREHLAEELNELGMSAAELARQLDPSTRAPFARLTWRFARDDDSRGDGTARWKPRPFKYNDPMILVLLLLTALGLHASPATPDRTSELLRAQDQALLDAIAPGDRKVWDHALAADAVYVDENGAIMSRSEFLKQLEPLPAGASGNIQISSYSAHISGDMATVIHTDDEQENYHGQMLHARYLTTETWRREAGEWKLHLVHTYAMLEDPPATSLPAATLQQYAGRYVAGDLVYVIRWDGRQLLGGREARPMKPLKVEVRDVLFVAGQPRVRKIFQRDESGHITGFVDRREGRDLVWHRTEARTVR